MKNSNMSARNAVSGSTEFPWKWKLEDLPMMPEPFKLEVIRLLDFSVPEITSYCAYKRGNALAESLLAAMNE